VKTLQPLALVSTGQETTQGLLHVFTACSLILAAGAAACGRAGRSSARGVEACHFFVVRAAGLAPAAYRA